MLMYRNEFSYHKNGRSNDAGLTSLTLYIEGQSSEQQLITNFMRTLAQKSSPKHDILHIFNIFYHIKIMH